MSSGGDANVMRAPHAAVLREMRRGRTRRQTCVFPNIRRCSGYARLHYRACEARLWLVGQRSNECPGLLIDRTNIRAWMGRWDCDHGFVGSEFSEHPLRLQKSLPQSPSAPSEFRSRQCITPPRCADANGAMADTSNIANTFIVFLMVNLPERQLSPTRCGSPRNPRQAVHSQLGSDRPIQFDCAFKRASSCGDGRPYFARYHPSNQVLTGAAD